MRKITAREIQEMANIISNWNDEKFKKWLEENKNAPIQPVIWGHTVSYRHLGLEEELEGDAIPLEQDENGTYGYKVLLRMPGGSHWLFSPTKFFNGEWVENRLTAHEKPSPNTYAGIYATKNLEELEPWFNRYAMSLRGIGICVVVKIRVWGILVEHSKGFRAEHAEIVRTFDGHW